MARWGTMRGIRTVVITGLLLGACGGGVARRAGEPPTRETRPARVELSRGVLAPAFEPNRGQAADGVRFLERRGTSTLFLTADAATWSMTPAGERPHAIRM